MLHWCVSPSWCPFKETHLCKTRIYINIYNCVCVRLCHKYSLHDNASFINTRLPLRLCLAAMLCLNDWLSVCPSACLLVYLLACLSKCRFGLWLQWLRSEWMRAHWVLRNLLMYVCICVYVYVHKGALWALLAPNSFIHELIYMHEQAVGHIQRTARLLGGLHSVWVTKVEEEEVEKKKEKSIIGTMKSHFVVVALVDCGN